MKSCPTCKELLVFPRGSYCYCEDCGWPDEDFAKEYGYPEEGDKLEKYQPHLEFYDKAGSTWVPSGVISATMSNEHFRGLYRYVLYDGNSM